MAGNAIPEQDLPTELSAFAAVEAAYPAELTRAYDALMRGLPVMVECEKELTPYFYKCLRDRLTKAKKTCIYLDGRAPEQPGAMQQGLIGTMITQLRNAVRASVEQRVVVLPHLDLLTSASGGLTAEAREVIPLLYENPEILWLGFKDPSFSIPKVIDNLFPHKESILGLGRDRLRYLVTQREARKFGRELNPYALYKHVSGVNAVRLRRLLGSLTGEDYPPDSKAALAQLRQGTLVGNLTIPDIDLGRDIGGYGKVKDQLQREIMDILAHKDQIADPEQIKRIEGLIPRGMIFWGPPGTGKTLFAKAMASSLGAAVIVVSGPELKSRWVGESEENIRQIFVRARQAAPAVIIFDELDSFASARGTYTGSGVEHSMVNQLLTEMDGFRKDELVFVVGTTNFVESLDAALLRPGRFEFHLQIPYPGTEDRRAIFQIYDRTLGLQLAPAALDYVVKRTADWVEGAQGGTRYSGDHIQAICRALARTRLRDRVTGETDIAAIEAAMTRYLERPTLTTSEERTVATHEAGHAVVGLFCPHSPPIDRISIQGDLGGALGFVRYADPAHKYVVTKGQLLDQICMLFGGREAESLFLEDVSIGAGGDLQHATAIARAMIEEFAMGDATVGARQFVDPDPRKTMPLSDAQREAIEKNVREMVERERQRARKILEENKLLHAALRDLLIEKKVLDRHSFAHLLSPTTAVANAGKKEKAAG